MKLACVREIAALAKAEISDEVAAAYVGQELRFGPDYLIPKPFDSRLILRIAPAVAKAALRNSNYAADQELVSLIGSVPVDTAMRTKWLDRLCDAI